MYNFSTITGCPSKCQNPHCYKFARNNRKVLQKCNINFLNHSFFADDDCGWMIENVRFATSEKRLAVMSEITFWSFSRHVAVNILPYYQF
jgi:hypothetical protein